MEPNTAGNEHHEYELYLAIENIDHTKTKARSPQTNGICERFHRTMQDEFYSIAFRKKLYSSLEDLQADVDGWLQEYNENRPHSGKYCFGKTPMQTFLEAKHLAHEKAIDRFSAARSSFSPRERGCGLMVVSDQVSTITAKLRNHKNQNHSMKENQNRRRLGQSGLPLVGIENALRAGQNSNQKGGLARGRSISLQAHSSMRKCSHLSPVILFNHVVEELALA